MSERFGMPGPSGSLGKCALCGGVFLAEILLGQPVKEFSIPGCNQALFGHRSCLEKYAGKDFSDLPPESPLRQAYEKNIALEKGEK